MGLLAIIVLGLIAGWIASLIVDNAGKGPVLDMVLGIVGALVGGEIFSLLGAAPITGFNLYSLFVAVIGSVVVLVIYHAVMGRRRL
ncbi:GlsB/YeaQ/YmgE family stress response membrane protein [Acidiphilium sp. AL]|uniref:GlsB/YeaQ/YmgE family stress response membrane protein n=1 Tax=Acidiphilium iwatense TaxID=768198 RepID=A0ABS9DUI6_9PROT|nr:MULTISPECIES: GlsB/YeaQ/YmgE family stress response membrane protein [Acidiphilium]MCF3945386.1 GlsB/YeaQ/YmgE family stress response membrane protein [Acidiphilium iwatense]MCU4158902.1 GlsB/YeaQ/YmgE family stress response membrane protein [Acidiphilium sp. AL]